MSTTLCAVCQDTYTDSEGHRCPRGVCEHGCQRVKCADCECIKLGYEITRLTRERDALSDLIGQMRPAMEKLAGMETSQARLREAITAAMHELGVPQDSYPAPVANAYRLLTAALTDTP